MKIFKPKVFALVLVALIAALSILRFCTSPQSKVERWLKIRLPSEASGIRYWYTEDLGSYQARVIARFNLPKEQFLTLTQKNGFTKATETNNGWPIPSNFNSDPTVDWWNPPEVQLDRYFRNTNNVETTLLWHKNDVYVWQVGSFGKPW